MTAFRLLVLLCLVSASAERADALTIVVDPGAVGTSVQSIMIPFTDLDGTALQGQSLSLDFVFADMKSLLLAFNDPDPTDHNYNTDISFDHDLGSAVPFPPQPSGFLSDENGSSIATPGATGVAASEFHVAYNFNFFESVVDGLAHYDIHFDVTFPNAPSASITSGTLTLSISSPQGSITVGEAPGAPGLGWMGLGLAGLAVARRTRARSS